ncbi:hypothetical protein [Rummeliibacillus pycnus]
MKPSKFETYLLDEEDDFQATSEEMHIELQPYEMQQYPEGFFTEL